MDNLNDRMNESLEFIRSRYGELLSLSEVATILKYDSVGAVRKAHSRKIGWTQNSEARSTELPFLLRCEFDDEVIFYGDQPEAIKIEYENSAGKKVVHMVTPDFLVITEDKTVLVECKKVSQLEKLVAKKPEQYRKEGERYAYYPLREAARKLGIEHVVTTDHDFSPVFTRNCTFLLNFIDELDAGDEEGFEMMLEQVRMSGARMRLKELRDIYPWETIIQAIYKKHLFVDIEKELFITPEETWVYHDKVYLDAVKRVADENELVLITGVYDFSGYMTVWWKNESWEVLNPFTDTTRELSLRKGDRIVSLSEEELGPLLASWEFYGAAAEEGSTDAKGTICSNPKSAIDEAIKRVDILNPKSGLSDSVSARTIRRYKKSSAQSLDGFTGLLPKTHERGNRISRLSPAVLELMEKHFQALLKPAPCSTYAQYQTFAVECEQKGLPVPSLDAFYRRFGKIDPRRRARHQKGKKAAYALGPEPRQIDFDFDLPYHGDTIFEVAHVDHTPVELTLVSKLDGKPLEGTINMTVMYDGYSRSTLAVFLSFEKPSYRSTMVLLRECYRRYQRLPLFLVVDHGPDFQSKYFDSTLAKLGIHKRRRPKGASRAGSIIERNFGTAETQLIHRLAGNRQLQKMGREQSSTHRPEKFATWTPDEFDTLLKNYAYHQHPLINQRGISETPIERWDRSEAMFDELPGTKVMSERAFYISTMPDVDGKGTRQLRQNQLVLKGATYLLSKPVPGYSGKTQNVPVKYDPYDISYVWACVNNHWVQLGTNDTLIRECFDRKVRLAHLEVFPRRIRNGRRYRTGAKQAVAAEFTNLQPEQQAFNIHQATIGESKEKTSIDDTRELQIDMESVSKLGSISIGGKGHE